MYCNKCGTKVEESDHYCRNCGTRLGITGGELLTTTVGEGNAQVGLPDGHDNAAKAGQAKAVDPPLVLEDWDFHFHAASSYEYFYRITLRLRNTQNKQIKLVDASVAFSDLLDQHMYGIQIPPDLTIAPGQRHTESGDYPVNEYINEQVRMKDMKKADIKAHLTVRRVVFSDNTILQVNP